MSLLCRSSICLSGQTYSLLSLFKLLDVWAGTGTQKNFKDDGVCGIHKPKMYIDKWNLVMGGSNSFWTLSHCQPGAIVSKSFPSLLSVLEWLLTEKVYYFCDTRAGIIGMCHHAKLLHAFLQIRKPRFKWLFYKKSHKYILAGNVKIWSIGLTCVFWSHANNQAQTVRSYFKSVPVWGRNRKSKFAKSTSFCAFYLFPPV